MSEWSASSNDTQTLPLTEYHELIDSLNRDKERVKKLERDAIRRDKQHKRKVAELQQRVLEAENAAKWVSVRNSNVDQEVQVLTKKLKHAMKVIVDLQAEKERLDPSSSLDEIDEEMYREIIQEAKSKGKGKAKAPTATPSTSSGTTNKTVTPRASASSKKPVSGLPASSKDSTPRAARSLLSPMSTVSPRGFPSSSHHEDPEEFVEAHESQPWALEQGSPISTPSAMLSPRTSITGSNSGYNFCIFWDVCPTLVEAHGPCIGPYSWDMLKDALSLSDEKMESLRTLERQTDMGVRLQLSRVRKRSRVAFLYRANFFEKTNIATGVAELFLVDWTTGGRRQRIVDYLKKEKVTDQMDESTPHLHIFIYVVDPAEGGTGWWYIGAMRWQIVDLPLASRTMKSKSLDDLAVHLSTLSDQKLSAEKIVAKFEREDDDFEQLSVKVDLVDKAVSMDFCLSVLKVNTE